ncbi:hypothetical protein [Streptomyces sp. NPDC055056]
MSTWREQLDSAEDWKTYRTSLRALREAVPKVTFKEMEDLSGPIAARLAVPGLVRCAISTFNTFMTTVDGQPEWGKVEMVVRTCAEKRGDRDVEAAVRRWAQVYRRCGGDPGDRFPEVLPALDAPSRRVVEPEPPSQPFSRRLNRQVWRRKPVQYVGGLVGAAALVAVIYQLSVSGNENDKTSPPSQSADSSHPAGADGTSSSTSTFFEGVIAWSNDGGGSGSQSDVVRVRETYAKSDPDTTAGRYNRGDKVTVTCQVTGGRSLGVGQAYPGPAKYKKRDADGVWYRMTSPLQGWLPGVYVDTGRDSLPAC